MTSPIKIVRSYSPTAADRDVWSVGVMNLTAKEVQIVETTLGNLQTYIERQRRDSLVVVPSAPKDWNLAAAGLASDRFILDASMRRRAEMLLTTDYGAELEKDQAQRGIETTKPRNRFSELELPDEPQAE